MAKVALITGANGITGSAILDHLVKHTTSDEWSRIILTSRSPLTLTVTDPRVEFIALDFTKPPKALVQEMGVDCADVTHAYFSSYVHKDDFDQLNRANRALFENFLDALLSVANNLQNCTLQTGGKYYNVHKQPVPSPACEDHNPRLAAPDENFYYHQEDFLAERQRGSTWTWNVIRPEAIIGYAIKPNGMNEALTLALYFLVCKELGEEAKMPTNWNFWNGTDDISDARLIADLSIFASTSLHCANEAFNVVNGDHFCWRYMWPRLAKFFGAKASSNQTFQKTMLEPGTVYLETNLEEWAKEKREIWNRACDKANVPEAKATFDAGTWAFQDWVFRRTWSATLSLNKARKFGWMGHRDSYESFIDAFTKFRELGQIP
jgi:nucleoside-diphosphate-sugar epimerase